MNDKKGEKSEKYVSFSVPIKKDVGNGTTIIYKIKLIDSFRLNQYVILQGLKITDYIINAMNVKKNGWDPWVD